MYVVMDSLVLVRKLRLIDHQPWASVYMVLPCFFLTSISICLDASNAYVNDRMMSVLDDSRDGIPRFQITCSGLTTGTLVVYLSEEDAAAALCFSGGSIFSLDEC